MELKVLIVDNEQAIRKGLAGCIDWKSYGCALVGQAVDGIEALEQIQLLRPDIVISDIRMPGMDGMQLSEHIFQHHPELKVILLTGYPDFEYAQKAIGYGVVDFVLKPTTVNNLATALERAKQQVLEDRSHLDAYYRLEAQSHQNRGLERSLFLNDLIQKVYEDPVYITHRARQLGLELRQYHLLAICIEISGQDDKQQVLSTRLDKVVGMLIDNLRPYPVHLVPSGGRNAFLLVSGSDTSNLLKGCRESLQSLQGLFGVDVEIGISLPHSGPEQLSTAAQQATNARQLAEYEPNNKLVVFSKNSGSSKQDLASIAESLKLLKVAVDHSNQAAAQELLDEIFNAAKNSKIPLDEVRNITNVVYNFCMGLQFVYRAEDAIADNALPGLEQVLSQSSMESMRLGLKSLLRQVMVGSQMGHTPDEIVAKVKAYIEQNYSKDLSLERLARQVYLSPSYLSKLFKRETKENLSSYLQNFRIDKAKALLLTTTLKTYQVAEKVGIPDPVYFSRLFKKVTGIKPKDFKKESLV